MKKIISLILLLMLAIPAVASACDCCPPVERDSSGLPALASHTDCCPMMDQDRQNCTLEKIEAALPLSPRLFLISEAGLQAVTQPSSFSAHSLLGAVDSGPPVLSSNTPLYLALQILRI
ncbi:MAG: hypothetical protein HYU34_03355 [Candidatus Omnitrophica bacterium]|nr:hypothetical protein [Candidatus Omnitrophota bacterium]